MSLQSENVIPGKHGKTFGTNAKDKQGLEKIKAKLTSIDGIKNVILNTEIYPKEFIIHTTKLVRISDIEKAVNSAGFHAIPRDTFKL